MARRVEDANEDIGRHHKVGRVVNSVEPMMAFYPQIKLVHIACVVASGSLFALRGSAVLAGVQWPRAAPARFLSYAIDTALLTAALMLLSILPSAMFANGWLLVKMCLLVVYIVLGSFALKRARKVSTRAICFVGALCVYLLTLSVAYWHHPLGMFSGQHVTAAHSAPKIRSSLCGSP